MKSSKIIEFEERIKAVEKRVENIKKSLEEELKREEKTQG